MYTGTVDEAPDGRAAPLKEYPEAARALALERFQFLRPALEEGVPLASVARRGSHRVVVAALLILFQISGNYEAQSGTPSGPPIALSGVVEPPVHRSKRSGVARRARGGPPRLRYHALAQHGRTPL